MNKRIKYILPVVLCLASCTIRSQNIDSLKLVLKTAKEDTSRINVLQAIVEGTITDDAAWAPYNQELYNLSEKLVNSDNALIILKAKNAHAYSLDNLGYLYNKDGNVQKALEYFNKCLKLRIELNDKNGQGESLNNIGFVYNNLGDIDKGLNYLEQSLKLQEQINNKTGIALALNNLAFIYSGQNDKTRALEYYKRSMKLGEEMGDKTSVANSYNNIGTIYQSNGAIDEALVFYFKSLKIREELNDKQGISYSLSNIGSVYSAKKDIPNQLKYYFKSLKLQKEINDKYGLAHSLNNIAGIYNSEKKYALANSYADSSLALSKEVGLPEKIRNAEEMLSIINSSIGNYAKAFDHYKQFIIYRDSLNNESTRKASIRSQLNYEFEKKEAVIKEQQEKERVVADEKNRFQKIVIVSVLFGLLLVIVFSVFVFRSLRITRHQKTIIEEKQKEILDSIYYAKRIQTSLLPTEKYINKHLDPNKKDQ
ncbi:MAG: tetratricopeptide repeat protein [Bacteroidia bacterium]